MMTELGAAVVVPSDALAANESMFKQKEVYLNNTQNLPWWPITIVPQDSFTFKSSEILIGSCSSTLNERSFEYGSSWVEHYYTELLLRCKQHHRFDIIQMLYQWYIAQFTLDYLHEVEPLTSNQFLSASNVVPELFLDNHRCIDICRACRTLMMSHDETLKKLHPVNTTIQNALDGFYYAVSDQCNKEVNMALEQVEFVKYMEYRTLNAGGLMGFIRQVYLLSYLFPDIPIGNIDEISKHVGLHVALVNDLYGINKDQISGEPNIIIKHQAYHKCTTLQESLEWAGLLIDEMTYKILLYNKEHSDTIVAKLNVAMVCISGNLGFHESSTRYKLPDGFVWPKKKKDS